MNKLNIDIFEYINFHTHDKDISEKVFSTINIFPEYVDEITDCHDNKRFSIGLHPWYIDESNADSMIERIKQASKNNNVIAIGETGLDKLCKTNYKIQQKYFSLQLEIAEEVNKPVILHTVKSYSEIISLKKIMKPKVPWIIHGYRGNIQTTEQLILKDFYFSFGDYISNNNNIAEVLKFIPDNRLFLENDDSEILTELIYKEAAIIRQQDINHLKKIIKDNFISLFGNI